MSRRTIVVEVETPIGTLAKTVTGPEQDARRVAEQIAEQHRALGAGPVTVRDA